MGSTAWSVERQRRGGGGAEHAGEGSKGDDDVHESTDLLMYYVYRLRCSYSAFPQYHKCVAVITLSLPRIIVKIVDLTGMLYSCVLSLASCVEVYRRYWWQRGSSRSSLSISAGGKLAG